MTNTQKLNRIARMAALIEDTAKHPLTLPEIRWLKAVTQGLALELMDAVRPALRSPARKRADHSAP